MLVYREVLRDFGIRICTMTRDDRRSRGPCRAGLCSVRPICENRKDLDGYDEAKGCTVHKRQ